MEVDKETLFIIPPAHLAELRRMYKEELGPFEFEFDLILESQIQYNRLYRRIEEVALHAITRIPSADESFGSLYSLLYKKAGAPDKPWVLGPEDCRAWRPAIDAFVEEHGMDWIFRDLARRKELDEPSPYWLEEYHLLREALDRAIADQAGLMLFGYNGGVEQKLADEIARLDAELQRDREGPQLTPEEEERNLAEFTAFIEENNRYHREQRRNAPPESDPDAPSVRMRYCISLYTIPAPIADRLLAMREDYDRMLRDSADDLSLVDRADELAEQMKLLAWDDAREFWDVRSRGHETAWPTVEKAILTALRGAGPKRDFIFRPADLPRIDEILQDWIAAQGGRDSAIAHVAASTVGESRTHAAQAIEHLERLIADGREHGRGLVRVPFRPLN